MPESLMDIKEELDSRLGKKVLLTAQAGRKRKTERKGILRETYHSVFVVDLDQEENAFERVSYSYADVLTSSVEISFYDEETSQYA
ncbi:MULTISPECIES: Veg family protein [unclassified Jeotgalibaca]|uniref:Veg family protein n=1 Tax=unclassified Jeotgalibaca TaxID=2621505 RepID=UPI003FD51425